MTDTQGGEAAVVDTTPQAAPEAALSSQEQGDTRDWEAEARVDGWQPKDDWKGDPSEWRSAEEFVRRGETYLPFIKRANKRLEAEVEGLKETNKRMSAMFEKTLERERAAAKKEIEDLKAERKAAIKAGDDAKADAIDQQIDDLKETVTNATEAKAKGWDDYADDYIPKAGSVEQDALTQAFVDAHDWMADPDMADYAERWNHRNSQRNPKIGFKENAKATVEAVKAKFPDYFKENKGTKAANGHAAVDGGGSFPGAQQAKGPASKLNQTELAQARKDVAAKLYANVDEWAKAYYS